MEARTTAEAAKFLGCSPTRVRQYLHEGRLRHGGYKRAPNGRVMALVEYSSLVRLKERRDVDPAVAAAHAKTHRVG